MMLIDIRCRHCRKLHCKVSRNLFGVIEFKCDKCKQTQTVSLASMLKTPDPALKPATIPR